MAAAATAFGRAGDPAKVNRTIAIDMDDTMRYSPSRLSLRMRKSPDMAHHDDARAVHVKPGANGEFVWTFDKAGEFAYACLIPGHYEAGMVGTLVVK